MHIRWFYKVFLLIGMGFCLYYYHDPTIASDKVTTKVISVELYNSYSGSIARSSGNSFVPSGWYLWGSWTSVFIDISATTWSTYTLTWNVAYNYTWIGSGFYTNTDMIIIQSGDGAKSLQSLFERWYERYNSNVILYMLDTIAPTVPILLWPTVNSIVSPTSWLSLQWSWSSDSGIWLSWYRVYLSLHPSFVWALTIDTSDTSLSLWSGMLPLGTIYRYVEALDLIGNTSVSTPWYFHYGAPTIVNGWWWGWWWYAWWYVWSTWYYYLSTTGSYSWGTLWWFTNLTGETTTILPQPLHPKIHYSAPLNPYVTNDIVKNLIWSYNNVQKLYPISMELPRYYRSPNMIHTVSPLVYDSLLAVYHGKDIFPIGYLTIYISRILLLFLFISYYRKNYRKKLTK
jgi:hypothetical protein